MVVSDSSTYKTGKDSQPLYNPLSYDWLFTCNWVGPLEQMVGQFLWCFAHTLWIGNSFTVTTSVGLLAHHLFGVWHGDKRQSERHGEAYNTLKERTSVFPFAAILDGRQKLPPDYYKEFLRVPYFVIAGLTLGAYWSQPFLQRASQHLRW